YSGDTILGEGTTIVTHPEGSLRDYLSSLDRLRSLLDDEAFALIEPAHGPRIDDPAEAIDYYRADRLERIDQVRAARDRGATTAAAVCDIVYHDVDAGVRTAAEQPVKAHLAHLDALPAADA